MKWHVVIRVGESDDFLPDIPAGDAFIAFHLEAPGNARSLRTNILDQFETLFEAPPTGIVLDLLQLASCVFCTDLSVPRVHSDDGWSRELHIYFPTSYRKQWKKAEPVFRDAMNFLSGDAWHLHLRERPKPAKTVPVEHKLEHDTVCLFSGGLDSLVGMLDLIGAKKRPLLIGHYGAGMTNTFQDGLLTILEESFPEQFQSSLCYLQPPRSAGASQHEPTMRSRSFLFLSLGLAAANILGDEVPLHVPENALISLNVPFTFSRTGSLSTRTTHPYFIALFRKFASELGIRNEVILPYRFLTKGEMLANCLEPQVLKKCVRKSMSCAHSETARWQGMKPGTHCGYCVPCLIRRASTKAAKIQDATYAIDVVKNPPPYRQKKGSDLRAVLIALDRYDSRTRRQRMFDVLAAGELPPDEIGEYADAYSRGMDELSRLLRPRKKLAK